MKKDPKILLKHILESIEWIERDVQGLSRENFYSEVIIQDAVLRRLEIIGEAVRNLDEMTKESNPNVPWIEIAGMRNKLIHEYFDVDLDLVWEVVAGELPEFKKHILELTK